MSIVKRAIEQLESSNPPEKEDIPVYKPPVFRTGYDGLNPDPGLIQVDIDGIPQISLTQQHLADDADINLLVKRYVETGLFPNQRTDPPSFQDVSDASTYQEAKNAVLRAEQSFNNLDPYIRKRFDNDPAKLLSFVDDPKNGDELIKMGLRTAPPVESTPTSKDDV